MDKADSKSWRYEMLKNQHSRKNNNNKTEMPKLHRKLQLKFAAKKKVSRRSSWTPENMIFDISFGSKTTTIIHLKPFTYNLILRPYSETA